MNEERVKLSKLLEARLAEQQSNKRKVGRALSKVEVDAVVQVDEAALREMILKELKDGPIPESMKHFLS